MIRRAARALALVLTIGVVALWAVALRPVVLGGPATYVVVRGDSMLPGLDTGDLVVLHAQPTYGPGDVVGYRVPAGQLGAGLVVVHRIAAGDGAGGFLMLGDNNPAPDPWRPTSADVVGRSWVVVPGVGRALSWIRQPATLGALAAAFVVLWVMGGRARRDRTKPEVGILHPA